MNGFAPTVRLSTLAFALLFAGAAISYMSQALGQLLGYLLSFSGLLALVIYKPIVSRVRFQFIFLVCMGILLSSLASMLIAHQYATGLQLVVQTLMYPVVFALLLLYGWRIMECDRTKLAALLASVGILNAVIALMASLGMIGSLPLAGEIGTGRYIFGTSIPSSTGLAFNVNYYATLQGTIFLLYGWLLSDLRLRRRRFHWLLALFLLVSVAIGSSRGVAAAMLVSGSVLLAMHYLHLRTRAKVRYITLVIPCVLICMYLIVVHWDWFAMAFRFSRGLNFRDVIWSAGLQIWLERPIMGYGYAGATREMLGDLIDRSGSLHSGFLTTLTRGGLLLFMIMYGSVVAIVLLGLGWSRKRWWQYRWPVAIVLFWLANSAIRSFNLGGLGLLPVAAGLALSSILYSRYREKHPSCLF